MQIPPEEWWEGSGVHQMRGFRCSLWKIMFIFFSSPFTKLNVVFWKENVIDWCLSWRSRVKWKWFWYSVIQGQILSLEDVLAKPDRGHCHHLLALAYTVLNSMKKSDGASACTSKPQQRHVPRGAKIDPQVRRIIPMTSSELWWSVPTRHAKVYYFINILWNVIILLWPTGIYKINDN